MWLDTNHPRAHTIQVRLRQAYASKRPCLIRGELMNDQLPAIRVSMRAFIQRNDKVLVQKKHYEDGRGCYCLPGGALDLGETLAEGLKRERAEEIGSKITNNDLVRAADYLKVKDIELAKRQVDVLWVKLADLNHEQLSSQISWGILK